VLCKLVYPCTKERKREHKGQLVVADDELLFFGYNPTFNNSSA
jgi:hypothetical protein